MTQHHDETPTGPSGSRLPTRSMTAVLLGLAVLALIAVVAEVIWLKPRHDEVEERRADRAAVVSTAQRFMVQWNTFEPTALDDYRKRVTALMSTKFKTEFEATFEDVARVVEGAKMESSGTVLKSGVATLDPDSARVLVVADATAKTTADTRERHFRWQLDLVKVDGKWLVDSWEAVQDQQAPEAP